MAGILLDIPPVVEEAKDFVNGLDTLWVLLGAMLVFWMQPGFALVEAGLTRAKNTANILMKNFCDFMCGSVLYWIAGFSIMYGAGNAFIGWEGFGFIGTDSNVPAEATFIFQTVFCATAATIVSGAMAERTKFSMYFVYSMVISLIIYPIEGHWSWGGGWLSEMGFHDFAGSTVVHLCGGVLALAGAIVLGPRTGKYDKDGKSKAIPGHNLTLCALGVFCLWVGWFGFNPCSTVAATGYDNATSMSHVFVTTNMAAATGGIAALIYTWLIDGKPSLYGLQRYFGGLGRHHRRLRQRVYLGGCVDWRYHFCGDVFLGIVPRQEVPHRRPCWRGIGTWRWRHPRHGVDRCVLRLRHQRL